MRTRELKSLRWPTGHARCAGRARLDLTHVHDRGKAQLGRLQRGGFSECEALQVIGWLAEERIDLLEISGGTYEAPALLGLAESTRAREAYFLDFARKVRRVTRVPLMVTGAFALER